MIFTDLTYTEVGAIVAALFLIIFAIVIIIRFMLAFKHYIYNGDFGDGERSAFVCMMEGNGSGMIKYAFIGYHPGMIFVDAMLLGIFFLLMIFIWGPMIILAFCLLLGRVMRTRIAVKQEFVAKLDGTHENE